MSLLEILKKRRSVRRFRKDQPIEEEVIEKLLEAAQSAPSAGNLQSYFVVVVQDPVVKGQLYQAALEQSSIKEAPVVLVVCADLERSARRYGTRGMDLYALQDATLAAIHLWLMVVELGLAAVWVGAFDEEEVGRLLGLSSHLRPIAILPVGYAAESPSPPPRRSVSEIFKKL